MNHRHPFAAITLAAHLLAPALALAAGEHDGHDHGAAAPAGGPALPRFAAESELFELVGVLKGKQLTLYLDRAADNSPVSDATIELEIAGKKFQASKQGADTFEIVLPEAPKPGVLPITATVSAGTESDLLAGELDIHQAGHADAAAHVHSWKEYAAWVAAGLAVLALMLVTARRVLSTRPLRVRGVA